MIDMKAWVIIAFLVTPQQVPPGQDMFVFTKPVFTNGPECVMWVQNNFITVLDTLFDKYGPNRTVETVICFPSERLPELLKNSKPHEGTNI